jgi:pimeloyl-ACP methyl ester carboxylesterase
MKLFKLICLFFCYTIFGQQSMFTLSDGVELFMEESGQGRTLIFIPGWTMTHKFFEKQKTFFSEKYHVLVYDPRGHGRSGNTLNDNHYAQHATDLREIIDKKVLKDVVLIGWSSGCLTIYEYLRKYGHKGINKLVMIDEPPKWIGDTQKEWVYGSFESYRSSLKGLLSEPNNPDGIINWMLKDSVDITTKAWMKNEILMTPPHVALSLYVDGVASDYNQELRDIEVPALFMVRDSWYDKVKEWLQTNAPFAKIVPIVSHAMFWERPQVFNKMLLLFIEEK